MAAKNEFIISNSEKHDLVWFEKLISNSDAKISLDDEAKKTISKCHSYLLEKIKTSDAPIYGINTGFGFLCDTRIENKDLEELQRNLILSHACGAGAEVPDEIVRLMLVLKVIALAKGHSGVALETVQRIIDFFNEGIFPVVYEQGSLGASGDLAPLAHLFLPLIGEGEVKWKGERMSGAEILSRLNWKPLTLGPKEGLALLNGTQFMLAYGMYLCIAGKKLMNWANVISAISLDGFDGRIDAFDDLIQQVRPHDGQIKVGKVIQHFLQGSEIANAKKAHVQDPYAFRCVPQVHGASWDCIENCIRIFEKEADSVSDNPLLFPDEDKIISGGNFHGQPLALSLDFLAIAFSEIGSISERRIFQLLSGSRGLPLFLTEHPGLHSGLMILQYTAASIASQNKQLTVPASTDSIVSSNGQEDHVSMGANAATKCFRITDNLFSILGIEMICASQAMWLKKPLKSSVSAEKLLEKFRSVVPPVSKDRVFSGDISNSRKLLHSAKPE